MSLASFTNRILLLICFSSYFPKTVAFSVVPFTSLFATINDNNDDNDNMFRSSNAAKTLTIRVVSYNVLSPNLATTASYPTLNPTHLDPSQRLAAVLHKLEQEMTHQRTIICLQEVTYDWAGSLHSFFANRGYHMVTGLYGRPYNGYMGVALAWPVAVFETLHVDISRCSDTRQGGWPRENDDDNDNNNNNNNNTSEPKPCFSFLSWLLPKFTKQQPEEALELDPWEFSERRFNVLLTATLKEKETGKSFCIGNYHMPCAFYAPQVMTMHSEMVARHVQRLAQQQYAATNNNHGDIDNNTATSNNNSLPCIVAGDWNIKPQDAAYKLLTTGALSSNDPAYPAPALSKNKRQLSTQSSSTTTTTPLMTWEPSMQAMRSAHAAFCNGQEPDFTNYAAPRSELPDEQECFIDTLDYIFISPEWNVKDCTDVPPRDQVHGPFPNLDPTVMEPSDHILIYAKLELQ